MKISWMSNSPWARTGYGCQTALFTPRIKALGHDVAITAFYGLEGGVLTWGIKDQVIPVYPRGFHPFGLDVMAAHAEHARADVLITLMDSWVIDTNMMLGGTRWVPWFPIDHDPLPAAIRDRVARAFRRIVFSRFGERMVHDAGLDAYYVPHGVDTQVFRPAEDRAEVRKRLQWPEDRFVVGMVATNKGNPPRKSFPQCIAAFAQLKRKHSDVLLYLHTVSDERQQGVNLPEFITSQGLSFGFFGRCDPRSVDVLFCDQYQNMLGYPDQYMVDAYNAMDVHLLVSMGEGFGIPILEAQACGCPVIVGDWTAMGELCFSGWKVARSDAEPYWTPLASYQFIPHVEAITERLKAAYRVAGNESWRKRAREGALAYDADTVTEQYWKPVLAEIAADIDLWRGQVAAIPEGVRV